MKSPIYSFFTILLTVFSLFQADLKANPEYNSSLLPYECLDLLDNPVSSADDNPCYPPNWYYTSSITQNSAIFQWEEVYGCSGYSIQWRYPNGQWYDVPGICYQTWINVGNFQPCSSYEWRVQSHCGGGYSSNWCSPVYFTTLCYSCPQPSNTYTSNITDHSADLHWYEVWGAQSYTVQIRWPSGSWTTIAGSPCQGTWLNVNGLQPGTGYDWRVRADCGYYSSSDWTYGWFATTQPYYCNYPGWMQCYNITQYTATWKWESVYGADCYSVQWRYPGGSWVDLFAGPYYGTWCNVNFLNPCTTYEWRVKSYCHYGGWSSWCYPYTFTTLCNYSCPVPTGLYSFDIGDYKATLKWAAVYGATSYSVQIKDQWGNWYDVSGSPTTGVWITVNNLSPCKSYEWRVKANCYYDSNSYWSKSSQFSTTCGSGCHAPQWVYTNGITNISASLHWASVDEADYYVVEWRSAGGTWEELVGGPWTTTWADLPGLQPNTTYEWHVKSHCKSGNYTDWSSLTSFTTTGLSCGFPFFRYTLPITDSTATFNWSEVAGALNYTVQIRPVNGDWKDVLGSPTTATMITALGLMPNTQYEWRMQVNCSNGAYSEWLSNILFTTGTSNGCQIPGSPFTDQITLSSAVLHWSIVPDAGSYKIEYRELPGGSWTPVPGSPVDTNFIMVDGLNPYTSYEWHVRTKCKDDNYSFWSYPVQFTTGNVPPCNPPDSLLSSSITETTATLSWSVVSGGLGYQVQTRLPNGMWVDLPGGVITDPMVLASGFTPNTTYEWHVRTQCDSLQFSLWSATGLFTTIGTTPVNDECATATLLTVESSCISTFASNIEATPSVPAPVGGCWANGYKDVWFRFNMPDVPNPAVTIRTSAGSLGNAVMEVYSGTDCSILSLITCEDDNDNGNGSKMPVINLTGTPNATIWVRVWGFDGSTGTFTICVFNYISFNYTTMLNADAPDEGAPLVEFDQAVPVSTNMDSKAELRVSPNPVSDRLDVMVSQTETCRVMGLRIMDLSGKIRFIQNVEPSALNRFRTGVDVSNLAPGIYVLQVQTTDGTMAEKISVIK